MELIPRSWSVEGSERFLGLSLQRLGIHPGATWSLSWLALFAGGILLDPAGGFLEGLASCVFSALFAGLTWLGALAFAGRRAPLWILPATLAFGLGRGMVGVGFGVEAGAAVSVFFEPAAILAAALVVWRAELIEDEPGLRIALAGSLVLVAFLEVGDALGPSMPGLPSRTPFWMAFAPVVAMFELGAMWAWIARREVRLENAEDEQRELEGEVARERRTSDLLRRKEAWLFDFFEKAPDLLIVMTPRTCEILRCNRRFSETLGHPRRDLVGRSLLEFVAPEAMAEIRPILASGRRHIRNLMLHLVRHDGSELVVLANLALRTDSDGDGEVRGVLHDVTRLEHSNQTDPAAVHRVLAEESAVGIFHVGELGTCDFVNPSFSELTGLSAEDAAGQSWLRCVHRDDRQRVEQAWDEAVGNRTVFREEHRIRPVAGVSIRVVTECIPVSDLSVGGIVGSMTRISGYGTPTRISAAPSERPSDPERIDPR